MKTTVTEVLDKVETAYPALRTTARLVIATAATTRLSREQPLAVILIGGASSGKTSLLMPLTKGKKGSALSEGVLRIDDFTPASLVSHAANRSEEQLAKIDLLPQMKDKVVIVKEMAPMFTGHEEDLMKKFGVFASILDGEGHISGSGSYGRRGYTDKITFSLMGAVTPDVLTQRVYNSLNAVGPRFCFWEMPKRKLDPANWRGPTNERARIEGDATNSVISFIEDLFQEIPAGSLERVDFEVSEAARETLSHIASLMALLRSKFNYEREDDRTFVETEPSTESPDRAYRYLEQIVLGSALIDCRKFVNETDLSLALGIALGSAVPKLRRVVRLFYSGDHKRTTHDLGAYLRLTEDTASKYARQLQDLNVICKTNFDGTTEWDLAPPFRALRSLFSLITHSQLSQSDPAKAPTQGPVDFTQVELV